MLSRVADSIFWMSRYIERAENVARFIDVNLNLTLDLGADVGRAMGTAGLHHRRPRRLPGALSAPDAAERHSVPFRSTSRIRTRFSPACSTARENARTVREMISSAMWEELNKFYLMVRSQAAGRLAVDAPYDFFNQIKLSSHLLEGITDATMSHGEPWHFARMGRLLERADKTSRILDVKYFMLLPNVAEVGTPLDTIQWSALLESASALEMYRKHYGRITPTNVAEFLMLDREFPRAMHFCLIKAEESLLAITGSMHGTFRTPAEQQLGRLRAELDYAHIDEIIRDGLHEFIDRFQTRLNQVGGAISDTFFDMHPIAPTRDARGRARSNGSVQTQTQTQS